MNIYQKTYRFAWRLTKNIICSSRFGRDLLYPSEGLSEQFGRGDAEYAWKVFKSHYILLKKNNFHVAQNVLEIGPGRNIGTALLFFCALKNISNDAEIKITCWDIYENLKFDHDQVWQNAAQKLLEYTEHCPSDFEKELLVEIIGTLKRVRENATVPNIEYRVCSINELVNADIQYDLIYSQAAIEHVWFISEFWMHVGQITKLKGWNSHRIDLADHGRRDSNFIEFLQWSETSYWLTQRFIPGSLNRARVSDHLAMIEGVGLRVIDQRRDLRERLPLQKKSLARKFRSYSDDDLLCTGVNLIAKKTA